MKGVVVGALAIRYRKTEKCYKLRNGRREWKSQAFFAIGRNCFAGRMLSEDYFFIDSYQRSIGIVIITYGEKGYGNGVAARSVLGGG